MIKIEIVQNDQINTEFVSSVFCRSLFWDFKEDSLNVFSPNRGFDFYYHLQITEGDLPYLYNISRQYGTIENRKKWRQIVQGKGFAKVLPIFNYELNCFATPRIEINNIDFLGNYRFLFWGDGLTPEHLFFASNKRITIFSYLQQNRSKLLSLIFPSCFVKPRFLTEWEINKDLGNKSCYLNQIFFKKNPKTKGVWS